jgi:DUF1680 family protein
MSFNDENAQMTQLLRPVDMSNVVLRDNWLLNASRREITYLLSFDIDRLLVEFRLRAGQDTHGLKNYGGWEAGEDTQTNPEDANTQEGPDHPHHYTGHFIGHYLTALAQASRATIATAEQKRDLNAHLRALIDGIRSAQLAYGRLHPDDAGFLPAFRVSCLPHGTDVNVDPVNKTRADRNLVVPFYDLHKLEQGLISAVQLSDDPHIRQTALAAASDFGNFIYHWHEAHPTEDLLSTEYGGMNDALYQLFALTGKPEHLAAAHLFDEVPLFTALANGKDVLSGLHANTTIPKFIGAVRRYLVLNNLDSTTAHNVHLSNRDRQDLTDLYLTAAINFWTIVTEHHSYANGDNSSAEHFHEPDDLWADATQRGEDIDATTCETCNAYNMLKLTRLLLQITHETKYSEYYEHTLTNTILPSQNPETGMSMYYQPMTAGYPKIFGLPFGTFWCCQGTGVENFTKLTDSIFLTGQATNTSTMSADSSVASARYIPAIYINQFRSSILSDPISGLRVRIDANLPASQIITISVSSASSSVSPAVIKVREPKWSSTTTIYVGSTDAATGSITLKRVDVHHDQHGWAEIPVVVGSVIRIHVTEHVIARPDKMHPSWMAFQYGPVLFSAPLTPTDPKTNWKQNGYYVRAGKLDHKAAQMAVITPANGLSAQQWADADHIDADCVRVGADQVDHTHDTEDSAQVTLVFKNVTGPASQLRLYPHYAVWRSTYALYFTVTDAKNE